MATMTTERRAITIEPVSLDAVRSLLAAHPAPCLSLYLPTHRNVPENTVDRPAYRHLVEALELALDEMHPRDEVERLLRPLRLLADDRRFWEHTRDGLAVLAADGAARVFLLQRPVPPLALVGRGFHTLPLVQVASSLERCHVLALTSRQAHVFEAEAWHGPGGTAASGASIVLDPVTLTTPRGEAAVLEIADVVDVEVLEPHRVKTGMGPAGLGASGIVHGGFGSRQDEVEKDTEIFLRFVDATVLEQVSRRSMLSLVLVAAAPLAATFRGLAKNPWLCDTSVPLDPSLLARDALAAAVAPVLVEDRESRVAREVTAFARARDRDLAASDLADVARAAVAGRVATLLLEADRFESGHVDRTTGAIAPDGVGAADLSRRGGEPAWEATDLFNAVAETVLEKGGPVVSLVRNAMPTESGVAAIYRY
jgi:hypothetical protein